MGRQYIIAKLKHIFSLQTFQVSQPSIMAQTSSIGQPYPFDTKGQTWKLGFFTNGTIMDRQFMNRQVPQPPTKPYSLGTSLYDGYIFLNYLFSKINFLWNLGASITSEVNEQFTKIRYPWTISMSKTTINFVLQTS